LFFTCFFLFSKYFPVIAIAEIKHVLKTSGESYKEDMGTIEKMNDEQFYESTHHDDHHGSPVKLAHN
jgi:molybdopterin-containing oxidoreductase family membrane subunit